VFSRLHSEHGNNILIKNIPMDLIDQIKQLGDRVAKTKQMVNTEEATKHSFVMPFIQLLGYDVFNPMEVVPEFVADLGIKQGEKVDYAIFKDGHPIILIECKSHNANLNVHNSQLFRYFHVSKAKFGLLTNGIEYRFYTDLDAPNKMDDKPFFVFNITDIKDVQVEEIKKFHKSYYDHNTIITTASELKYTGELKAHLNKLMNDPTPEFVRFLARDIYSGVVTQKVLETFTHLVKRSFQQYLNDLINDRLKSAIQKEETITTPEDTIPQPSVPGLVIETTKEEYEAFHIIKSIVRPIVEWKRVYMRDAQSYCAVLLDDNNRKPICRFYFTSTKKSIAIIDASRKETKYEIKNIEDIYDYAQELTAAVKTYLTSPITNKD
jgi:predicted type IV restriction endonuclease